MNRRVLLQTAGASALAQGAAAPKIRVGFLGTGHSHFFGKYKAIHDSPHYEIAGIAEANPELRADLAKDKRMAGIPVKWVDEDALLGDKATQLIVVECRVWEALDWGAKVVRAGKHLHLEKPVGNQWQPYKKLVEDARSKKLLFQSGYVWRFHEGIAAALEAARKGWLGDVFLVRGTMNSDRDAEGRAIEAKYKGGGMFELSGHVIDRVVALLGRPRGVRSWLRHDTSEPDKLADNNLAVFEYDRALAVIAQAAKMAGSGDHRSLELVGTDGTIIVHPEANPPRMRVFVRTARGPYKAGWQDITLKPQPRFVPDFAEMARALQTGTPLQPDYDHELLLHETLLRASGEMS